MAIEEFRKLLGKDSVLDQPSDLEHYAKDWLKGGTGKASLVLLPSAVSEVKQIVDICRARKLALVPSGGRTGLSGGAAAINSEIVLSLERLNKILEIDTLGGCVTCQAGVITQKLQERVQQEGLYFPIDLASKGSSQIGGNIATNAGGVHVVRYGALRNWVLGLKVVTGSGEILDLNGKLIKNQTGYDLRSLFIGSEGTLGIVVEATLKLAAKPSEVIRALCALERVEDAVTLFAKVRSHFDKLSMFEYFSSDALSYVMKHHSMKLPLEVDYPHYALIELEKSGESTRDEFEEFLGSEMEAGLVRNAAISASQSQAEQFLRYRELIPDTLSTHYFPHKNDLAVPISSIAPFLKALDVLLQKQYPDFKTVSFGHIGDGNMHVNVLKPENLDIKAFRDRCAQADTLIFELIQKYNGSISAEHGIGWLKKPYLKYSRSTEEIRLMKELKKVFDPGNILNPGKIFD